MQDRTFQDELWGKVIFKFANNAHDLPTRPKVNKDPVWFNVSTDGKNLYVNTAKVHAPSSEIKTTRTLNYEEFLDVLPFYYLRKDGASTKGITEITYNSVYWFSILEHCEI